MKRRPPDGQSAWFSTGTKPEDRETVAQFLVGIGNAVLAGNVGSTVLSVETRHYASSPLQDPAGYEIALHFHMKDLPDLPEEDG